MLGSTANPEGLVEGERSGGRADWPARPPPPPNPRDRAVAWRTCRASSRASGATALTHCERGNRYDVAEARLWADHLAVIGPPAAALRRPVRKIRLNPSPHVIRDPLTNRRLRSTSDPHRRDARCRGDQVAGQPVVTRSRSDRIGSAWNPSRAPSQDKESDAWAADVRRDSATQRWQSAPGDLLGQ